MTFSFLAAKILIPTASVSPHLTIALSLFVSNSHDSAINKTHRCENDLWASKRGNYAQADAASIRGDQLQSLQMSLAVSLVQFLLYEVRTAAQEQFI